MKLPKLVANPGLAALLQGSGFPSLERFANAINLRGWEMHGVKLSYDHISVKRWLAGSVCQNPDVVAAVLSDAWGITVPATIIWPELRDGQGPTPAHLQPWVAARTLENLGALIGSDMLTRREALAAAIDFATGASLVDPIARRLDAPPGRLAGNDHGVPRVGLVDVEAIEQSTWYFAATDAKAGGALSREAAVGQLKYAVDLARHGSYSERTGNRLLAAVAELAGLVGWLCHDSKMPGPAQRYFTYGLQAARESTDPRAPLLVISILSDMAQHMKWLGRPNTALRLHDLAINELPHDRSRFNVLRAVLATKRAENGLCYLGASCLPEVQSATSLSLDLYGQASEEDRATASSLWHRAIDTSEAELSAMAAATYLVMARDDPKLAGEVEQRTLRHLAGVGDGQGRNKVFSLIRLASARFIASEPEQACADGERALASADDCASAMVSARLRDLVVDSKPYGELPKVKQLQERVRTAVSR